MTSVLLALLWLTGVAQPGAQPLPHETFFYMHDGLKLEAYLYKPEGAGPFPLVVYNHGSAEPGKEREEWPAPYIARLVVPAGLDVWRQDALDFLASVTRAQPAAQAPQAPPDQFFDSNGVKIRYVEQGTGPAIVLMHGYTGTLDRHFIANGVFASLATNHRAIAIDLRGHGKSGKPHDPKAYGDEMARDVVRLLDHLKIQRAHVLGYSLGAMVAGRVATMSPGRLIGVIYSAGLPLRDAALMESFANESIAELESDLPFKSLMVRLQPPGSAPPSEAEMRAAMAPLVAANDVKAFAALWRGYRTLIVTDAQLAAVRVPSIAIIGSDDINAAGVPDLNKTQPQIRTVIVQGAQHGGPEGVMRRREFMTALQEFLAPAK